MTAKLATAHDQSLARLEDPSFIEEGIVSRSACDKLRFGIMQFDCGYALRDCPSHRGQGHHGRSPARKHTDFRSRSGHKDHHRQENHGG